MARKKTKASQYRSRFWNNLNKLYNAWLEGEDYWKILEHIDFKYTDEYNLYKLYFSDMKIVFKLDLPEKKLSLIRNVQDHCKVSIKVTDEQVLHKFQPIIYHLWDRGGVEYIKYVMKKNSERNKLENAA